MGQKTLKTHLDGDAGNDAEAAGELEGAGEESTTAPSGAVGVSPEMAPSGATKQAQKRKQAPSGAVRRNPENGRARAQKRARRHRAAAGEWKCEVMIVPFDVCAPPITGLCAGVGGGDAGTSAGGRRNKKGVG